MLTLCMTIAVSQSLITISDAHVSAWLAIIVSKHKTLLQEAVIEPLKTHRKLHRFTSVFKIEEN